MGTHLRVLESLVDGRFHSGEALARRLGVSRAAVWKAVQGLGKRGVAVHAVRGRGYRLAQPLELFERARIEAELGPAARDLLGPLAVEREIDSTSSYLVARAAEGGVSGSACVADSQHGGRGRLGRSWCSPLGCNVYLSVLWRYPDGPGGIVGLSLAVGVLVARTLRALGAPGIALKWPNDLVDARGKLGGVLLESSGESGGDCQVIVGVGLNLGMESGQGAAIDQPWADLGDLLEPGQRSRNRVAGRLLDRLLPALATYPEDGLAPYLDEWREIDALAGREVELRLGERIVRGRHAGIDADGALLIDAGDGVRRYHGGEVSVRAAG